MATYTHDSASIAIQNCMHGASESFVLGLPKGTWKKKLEKVKKKIRTKFDINEEIQWIMSINGNNIDPNNLTQFGQILSTTPLPITIKVQEASDDDHKYNDPDLASNQHIQLVIHYQNAIMSYQLSNDTNLWTKETYDELCKAIKTKFEIKGNINITNQTKAIDLDDIDDINDEYEKYENDPNFEALHFHINPPPNKQNDDQKSETIQYPKVEGRKTNNTKKTPSVLIKKENKTLIASAPPPYQHLHSPTTSITASKSRPKSTLNTMQGYVLCILVVV